MSYHPIIIIGAPRSGTNMLRDMLTSLPGFATWPCDEINYIWRHGNIRHPSDEFDPGMATPDIRNYIRRQFARVASRYDAQHVVEKTCANSLRVGYVDAIVPEAKYLVIRRNGFDAAMSAMKRWKGDFNVGYLLRKSRFVPPTDLPYYFFRFVRNQLHRVASGKKRLSFWGPMLADWNGLPAERTLEQLCILQWKRCVDASDHILGQMSSDKYYELEYDTFVHNATAGLAGIVNFLGVSADGAELELAARIATRGSVGKGRRLLSDTQHRQMLDIAADTLGKYGYI